jgi:hypothetical protein
MKLFRHHKRMAISGLALTVALVAGGVAYGFFSSPGSGTGSAPIATVSPLLIDQLGGTPLYNSTIDATAYQASQCFYCVGMGEFGNRITLASAGQPLSDAVLAMANFGATAGTMNVTLKVFNAGSGSTPGSLLATDTESVAVPAGPNGGYGSTYCTTTGASDPTCGIANFNATFNFASQDVTLPGSIVYEVQYNDPSNAVDGGVNVQLVNETSQVTVGSDADPGNLFVALASTSNGDGYTETGQDAAPGEISCETGSSTFTELSTASCSPSSNGYGTPAYVPAIEFDTNSMSGLYPGGPSQPINFSITNTGSTPATVSSVTVTVSTDNGNGLAEDQNGNDIGGCAASWFTISPSPDTTGATVPAGGTVDWIGTENISMPANASTNQDACEGKSLGLTFTSN